VAIKAINLGTLKSITFPEDTDDPTVWEIGAIDSRVLGHLRDKATDLKINPDDPEAGADISLGMNEFHFQVAQFGLKGFSNFQGEDIKGKSKDVMFSTQRKTVGKVQYDVCDDAVMAMVPGNVLQFLANEVLKINNLGEDEGKG